MALIRVLTLAVLVGAAVSQHQWRAGLRLGDLAQFTSTLEASLDRLADHIEREVESSLPLWMRNNRNRAGVNNHVRRADTPVEFDDGLEAISGTIGGMDDGVDDGLKVHMNGDVEGEVLEPIPEEEVEVESLVPSHHVPRPDFDVNFGLFSPYGGNNNNNNNNNNPFGRPFFNWFDNVGARRRQWWKGPNVCVDQEEIDEGNNSDGRGTSQSIGATFVFSFGQMEMTSCQETSDKYTCTTRTSKRGINKTVKLTHRCCHGFVREMNGCTRVELRDMPETLEEIGATDFLLLTKAINMERSAVENVTFFVPTNEAMQEFTIDLEEENEFNNNLDARTLNEVFTIRRRSVDTQGIVQAHVTKGVHYTNSLRDEQVLESVDGSSILRINTYSTTPATSTVNCARLVSVNHHTTNGVVHTIDRVLRPVTKSLAEIIKEDPQFSIMKRLLSKADMLHTLEQPGQLTVFVPTDEAFRNLPEFVVENLLEGSACLDTVVKNHILPNVICTAAIQGKARTVNLLENFLTLEKTEEEQLFVGESKVVLRDIMGTNGVLQVVDSPLMPQEAKPVRDVLERHNLTRFMELLEIADMMKDLANLTDVTVFAPSNRAVDEIPAEVLEELKNDPTRLREIMEYHIATPSLKANDISNNHMATTQAEHPLRINLYTRSPLLAGLIGGRRSVHNMRMTAGCSPVSVLDSRACGAIVHVVEKVLVVPRPSVMDLLEADEDYSIFTELIKNTGLNETLAQEGPFTVLAPTDHVFKILPDAELELLLEDRELQEQLVTQHILEEHVCCTGINTNTWLFMDHKRALNGNPIHVRRTNRGRLMAGPARITHCSSPTYNGLVHTVNHLMQNIHRHNNNEEDCQKTNFSTPGLEILFGRK